MSTPAPSATISRPVPTPAWREPAFEQPERLVIQGVSFDLFEKLSEWLEAEGNPTRLAYSDGMLELMPPLPLHEIRKARMARLLENLSVCWGFEMRLFGSTTWKQQALGKGVEPDVGYLLGQDIETDQPERPTLAIEVELTRSALNKLDLYAALGVPELWRVGREHLEAFSLKDGVYQAIASSVVIPGLSIAALQPFVFKETKYDTALANDFIAWAKANRPEHFDS